MAEKKKSNKNPELVRISSKLFTLRRSRQRELTRKNNRNEDLIEQLDKEIDELLKEREAYHRANGDGRGSCPRKKSLNGYYTISSSPKGDAQLAEDLHYPDIVVKMLREEQDEKKRMRILEQARLGSYGNRGVL